MRAGHLGEGNLKHQALVDGRAHLVRGVAQDGEDVRQAVGRAKGRGLFFKALQLIGRGSHRIGTGRRRQHIQVAHVRGQLARELQKVAASAYQTLYLGKQGRDVALGQGCAHVSQHRARDLAQEVLRAGQGNLAGAKDAQLLERGQGVAHAAARVANHQLQGLAVVGEALLLADMAQVLEHLVVGNAVEVKALDARQDGGQNLLRVGGTHDKDHVLGRLFEGLEQGIERRRGQHVDLVDDINLATTHRGGVVNARQDLFAHVVDARARGGVELGHVGVLAGRDQAALLAGAVGQLARALLAHKRLGQQAGHGRLARAAGAAEQVGVAGAVFCYRSLEGLDHVFLADYLLKRLRAILCVKGFHRASARFWLMGYQYTRLRAGGSGGFGSG